jgi:transcriptional regulator with XRE-family HTH domain
MIKVVIRMNLKEFGIYFAKMREKSGYRSQRELADKSGISHSTINRIEAGTHKASVETLKAVAPYLKGVTLEELLKAAGYLEDLPSYQVAGQPIQLTAEEAIVFQEMRRHPQFNVMFHDLATNPEKKVKALIKMWEALKATMDEEDTRKDGFGEIED